MVGFERGDVVAEVAMLAGDYELAADCLRAWCDACEKRGELVFLPTYAPKLGRALCTLGRFDEAEPLADLSRELGREHDLSAEILWRQVKARVQASRGEHDKAEQLARQAVAIGERTDGLNFQGDALCDLAEVLETAGKAEEAVAALRQALERYERKKNLVMAGRVRERLSTTAARR
jgi:tetratricopeptide (TPR) repeat protein